MNIDLPEITPKRIAIKLKPAAEKHVKRGHPWIYDAAIVKKNKDGNSGDLAIIFDQKNNRFLAVGLYDPDSPIRIRVLQHGKSANINEQWFMDKIASAHELRESLLATETNSYRLINGENDGFSGLIVDVYTEVAVVKMYSAVWLPYLKWILPAIVEVASVQTLVMRLSRNLMSHPTIMQYGLNDGKVMYGQLDNEEVIFKEHGVLFKANVIKGHKTGFFLDHRFNRKRVGELASGKKVLDVFSYAGGFSVHALKGRAEAVWSLDISVQALEVAQKNAALNHKENKMHIIAADAFVAMEKLKKEGKKFELVIVDPPSFAKKQDERNTALKQYERLVRMAIPLVAKGGILLMASCSSRILSDEYFDLVLSTVTKSGRSFREMERHLHDIDHPVTFPEGAYLKSIYLQMD